MSKRAAETATLEKLLPSAKIHSNHKLSQPQAVCTATGVRVPNQGHIEQGAKLARHDLISYCRTYLCTRHQPFHLAQQGFIQGGGGGGEGGKSPPNVSFPPPLNFRQDYN